MFGKVLEKEKFVIFCNANGLGRSIEASLKSKSEHLFEWILLKGKHLKLRETQAFRDFSSLILSFGFWHFT